MGEKAWDSARRDSINFQSVEDELRYLEENDLEAQLEHIEKEHLDFLLRWDDPMEFIPAVFPHLGIFTSPKPTTVSGDGTALKQYIQANRPAIADELNKERPSARQQ